LVSLIAVPHGDWDRCWQSTKENAPLHGPPTVQEAAFAAFFAPRWPSDGGSSRDKRRILLEKSRIIGSIDSQGQGGMMIELLTAPANLPFSVALVVMALIGVIEAVGLGASVAHLDMDADAHAGDFDLLAWLGIGRIPLLMVLVVFLAIFGLLGLALQQLAAGLTGAPLSPWLAGPAAAFASFPLTGVSARGLARIIPQDETTAVSLDTLIGKRGTITIGTARRGSPAQARVRDAFGQVHYVMVEPHDDAHPIAEGETVLLARRDGHLFIALGQADGLTPHIHEQLKAG
jgi:hypothetical protein